MRPAEPSPWRCRACMVFLGPRSGIITSIGGVTSLLISRGQLLGAVHALHILGMLTHNTTWSLVWLNTAPVVTHSTVSLSPSGVAESGGVRGALSTPMHWRWSTMCARRSRARNSWREAQAPRPSPRTRTPPRARARSRCVRHTPPPARVPSPPLIHYLRTADRFQARSFCPPLHDDRSNLMPFLCPASNAIRLRSASCGSRCSRAAAVITDVLDNIINKNRAIPPQLNRCTEVQELVKCDTNAWLIWQRRGERTYGRHRLALKALKRL